MGYPDWCEIKGALAARSLNGQVVIFLDFCVDSGRFYWRTAAEMAIYGMDRNAFLMRDLRISLLKYLFCTGGD
jgi:hypothetical protein